MAKHYSKTTRGFYCDDFHAEDQIPADAVVVTDDLYTALFAAQAQGMVITMGTDGLPVAVDPSVLMTPAQASARLSRAVQEFIDATAKSLGYDNILAAISYADEPAVPKFQAEGAALRAWRSTVWAAAMPALAAVTDGGALPTAAALVGALPAFTPPAV